MSYFSKSLMILAFLLASPIGSLAADLCPYAQEAIDIPGDAPEGKIALTFDDGPNAETTPKILDILKKYHIKATFFLIGEEIHGKEKIVQRMVKEGHLLGNHSWDHPHFHDITIKHAQNELLQTEKMIAPLRDKRRPHVMRFPYGSSTCETVATAEKMKYTVVGWDIDSCDWSFADHNGVTAGTDCIEDPALFATYHNDYAGWLDYQLSVTHGGVILNHDIYDFTVKNLEANILRWRKAGYTFVSIDDGSFPGILPNPLQKKTVPRNP